MTRLRDQQGVTLIELLLAAGIAALITGALGTAIHQFITTSERGNDELTALNDVQNAGHWLTRDAERAEATNLVESASPVQSMTLSWTCGVQTCTSAYSLSGTELRRNRDGTVTTVARHVSAVGFSISGRVLTSTITSTPAGRSGVAKQVTRSIWLRPTD